MVHPAGVTFGNNTFVGVGHSGTIVRSTDNGSSFSTVTSPTANSLYGVTYTDYVLEQMGGSFQGTELSLSAVVTTLAGGSRGSTDATGTSARFNYPMGITTDGTNLYVADTVNHRIRKILISTGVVTTLAGSSLGYTDSTGTSSKFSSPYGITTDGTNLYVADSGNDSIRKIE